MAMSKYAAAKPVIILVAVAIISLAIWDNSPTKPLSHPTRFLSSYQTSSNRTSNVQTYCPANVDRTTLAPNSDISTAQSNMNGVRS
jgi:hypothetical protein